MTGSFRGSRFLVALTMVAVLATSGSPGSAAADVDPAASKDYFEEARSFVAEGDIDAAVIQLKNAIKSDPDNADARALLGQLYLRRGDVASAEKELLAAQKRGRAGPGLRIDLARVYIQLGRYQEALDQLPEALAVTESRGQALAVQGLAEIGLGRLGDAERTLETAKALMPDDARIHVAIARLQVQRNDPVAAEAAADAAIALEADNIDALIIKGELRRIVGDEATARTLFDRVVALEPANPIGLLGRATVLVDLQELEAARADLEALLADDPTHALANYLLAMIRSREGDYTGARDALGAAGTRLEEYPPAVYLAGAVDYALGDYEQSVARLSSLVVDFPGHVMTRKLLGAAFLRSGDANSAIAALEPLRELAPDDTQALGLLGSAYTLTQRYAEATETYQHAVDVSPDAAAFHTQLALTQAFGGDVGAAMTNLEAAIDLSPEQSQAQILLVLFKLKEQKYDEALTALDRLRATTPDSPINHNLMGAALLGKGDAEGARASFEAALAREANYTPAILNLAQLDRAEGKSADASLRYLSILGMEPGNARARISLAEVAIDETRFEDARKILADGVGAPGDDLPVRLALIEFDVRMGDIERALASAREAALMAPNNPVILRTLGMTQLAAADTRGAVETFRQLTVIAPNSAEAFLLQARAFVADGRIDDALTSVTEAQRLAPDDIPTRTARIQIEIEAGHIGRSIELAEELRAEQPGSDLGDLLIADANLRKQDYAAAVAAFDRALTINPDGDTAIRRFTAQRNAGQVDEALATLVAFADANPDATATHYAVAQGYLETGHDVEAIARYEALLGKDPDDVVTLNNLAWLYQKTGDGRALATASRAVELVPENAAILDTLGWIQVDAGNIEDAIQTLRKAASLAPDQAEIRYHYAVALDDAGRKDEACRELRDLMALGGDFPSLDQARELLRALSCG